jgi:hypothetical protein
MSPRSSFATTIASSTLMTLAGRWRPCGSYAAMTAPLSMSASNHDAAVMPLGGCAWFGGRIRPHSPSRSPPIGFSGTSSGIGAF